MEVTNTQTLNTIMIADVLTRDYVSYREVRFIEVLRFLSGGRIALSESQVQSLFEVINEAEHKGSLLNSLLQAKELGNSDRILHIEADLLKVEQTIAGLIPNQPIIGA